jgi:hypothetical protein
VLAFFYFSGGDLMLLHMFADAAFATAQICAMVAGVVSTILVFCLVLFLLGLLACVAFDRLTAWMAARWRRKGRQPSGRIARVILAHGGDGGV